jgi:PKD repeat protein
MQPQDPLNPANSGQNPVDPASANQPLNPIEPAGFEVIQNQNGNNGGMTEAEIVDDITKTPAYQDYLAQKEAMERDKALEANTANSMNEVEIKPVETVTNTAQIQPTPMLNDNPALKFQLNNQQTTTPMMPEVPEVTTAPEVAITPEASTTPEVVTMPVAEAPTAQAPTEPSPAVAPVVTPEPEVAPTTPVTPTTPAISLEQLTTSGGKKSHIIGLMIGLIAILTTLGGGFSTYLFLPQGSSLLGEAPALAYILVMVIMGLTSLLALLGVFIGSFKMFTAKKEDKPAKKKGFGLTLIGTIGLVISALIFVIAFVKFGAANVNSPDNLADLIETKPAELRDLVAPVEVSFDASKLPYDAKTTEIISYVWDFTDGDRATGSNVKHTFNTKPDSGVYNVKLTVLFQHKQTGEQKELVLIKPVAISNQKALVDFDFTPNFGGAPIKIKFDASKSEDEDGEIVVYEWDFDGDTIVDSEGVTTEFEYKENGTYDVTLTVTDTNGDTTSKTKQLKLEDDGGFVIAYAVSPADKIMRANIGYQFDASFTKAPEGKITKYSWDFGDNTGVQQGQKVTHAYKRDGIYNLKLTVVTDQGKSKTKEFKVKIGDLAIGPKAAFVSNPAAVNGVITGNAPLRVSFDATGSKDLANDIVNYSWDFNGDGTFDKFGAIQDYIFDTAGSYTVKLQVTDSENTTGQAQVKVQVGERSVNARVTATPVAGEVPLEVYFDASGTSTDEKDPVVAFEWNFGDNTPVRRDNAAVTYVYRTIGTYKASVTAITASNKRSKAEITINVNPVSLKACFTASRKTGVAPLTVEFSAKCTRGVVGGYTWSFGDGEDSIDYQPTHTFTKPGRYTVKLTVDKDNVIDSYTDTIEVK